MDKRHALVLGVLGLVATANYSYAVQLEESMSENNLHGEAVAAALHARYIDTRENCGADSKPAFLCSGILLRGTERSDSFDPWNPSPNSVRNGGVSFTFVRSDYKVKRPPKNYASGFIFSPILNPAGEVALPPEKLKYQVLCFFPVDSHSSARPNGGCGPHPNFPVESVSCELQRPAITTDEQWLRHYTKYPAGGTQRPESACGFNVRVDQESLAGPRFDAGLRGGRLAAPAAFDIPNDTKIATWAQNIPAQLPIEAFIYIASSGATGLEEARNY
ncbi:halovibrin HvnA [Pseudomonas sp. TE21394]